MEGLANKADGREGSFEAVTRALIIAETARPYDGADMKLRLERAPRVSRESAFGSFEWLRNRYGNLGEGEIALAPSLLAIPLIDDAGAREILRPAHYNMLKGERDRAIIPAIEMMGSFLMNLYDKSYAASRQHIGHYLAEQRAWIFQQAGLEGYDVHGIKGSEEIISHFLSNGTPVKFKLCYVLSHPENVQRLRDNIDRGLIDKINKLIELENSSSEGTCVTIIHPEQNPFALKGNEEVLG